jgi:hypothetical protein
LGPAYSAAMPRPEPVDRALYARVKREASARFGAPSSWYRSAWIVKTYKARGGRYGAPLTAAVASSGLIRWARERWVNLNAPLYDSKGALVGYEACGRRSSKGRGPYPLCRPTRRVSRGTPRTLGELPAAAVEKARRAKRRVKSSGRVRFAAGVPPAPSRAKSTSRAGAPRAKGAPRATAARRRA